MFPTVNVDRLVDDYWYLKCLRNEKRSATLVDVCINADDKFEALKSWMMTRYETDTGLPKGINESNAEFETRIREVKSELLDIAKET